MKKLEKFVLLFAGCFLITMAFVPLVMWANIAAEINLHAGSVQIKPPHMSYLAVSDLLYSAELAVGFMLVKYGLKGSMEEMAQVAINVPQGPLGYKTPLEVYFGVGDKV